MSRRLFSSTFLSVVLLFAQGGSFLIAALCPHLRAEVMRCDVGAQDSPTGHHHMADMEMDPQAGESLINGDASAIDRPVGSCAHCAVHSRTTSTFFAVRHVEAITRVSEQAVALVFETPGFMVIQASERFTGRSHGPPGNKLSRHVLISIFRI